MAVEDHGVLPNELVGERVLLRRYTWSDAGLVLAALSANREHLARWMPWAQEPPTAQTVHDFLEGAIDRFGQASADYAITVAGEPLAGDPDHAYVGGCGLIDRIGPDGLEIGYWLDAEHTGRGLVTEAADLLTAAGLGLDGIGRVEIHCDQANVRSAAVPARLGYRLDRIEPDQVRTPAESGHSMIWVCDALACQGACHG